MRVTQHRQNHGICRSVASTSASIAIKIGVRHGGMAGVNLAASSGNHGGGTPAQRSFSGNSSGVVATGQRRNITSLCTMLYCALHCAPPLPAIAASGAWHQGQASAAKKAR
jgi:hypothetical protein